jgi:hypothetical protein
MTREPEPDSREVPLSRTLGGVFSWMIVLFVIVVIAVLAKDAKSDTNTLLWCLSQPELKAAITDAIAEGSFEYKGARYAIVPLD